MLNSTQPMTGANSSAMAPMRPSPAATWTGCSASHESVMLDRVQRTSQVSDALRGDNQHRKHSMAGTDL